MRRVAAILRSAEKSFYDMSQKNNPSVAADPTDKGAILFLAGLEILAALLDMKKTSSLLPEDHDKLENFHVTLTQTKEALSKSQAEPFGSALEVSLKYLTDLVHTINNHTNQLETEYQNIDNAVNSQNNRIKSLLMGNGVVSRWLLRSNSSFCRDCGIKATNNHKGGAIKTIKDEELDKATVPPEVVSAWAAKLSSAIDDARRECEDFRRALQDREQNLNDLLSRNYYPIYRKGRLPQQEMATAQFHRDASHEIEVLNYLYPPKLTHLELSSDLNFFLNLAEDVDSGAVSMRSPPGKNVGAVYQSLMQALHALDKAISCIRDGEKVLDKHNPSLSHFQRATQTEKVTQVVHATIDKALQAKPRHTETLKKMRFQASAGNISKAKKALNQLEAEGRFSLPYDEVKQLITKQETTFSNLEKVFHKCVCECERQNSTIKKISGMIFGVSHDELRNMLFGANQAVKKAGWAIGSELSQKVHLLIVSAEPACELTDMCFSWGQFNVEPILAKMNPRKLKPEIAFINALCAIASSDGDFCQKEQSLVSKIIHRYSSTIPKKTAAKAIHLWAKAARSAGLVEAVAQSIVDVDNVKATPLQSLIHKCLLNVVNADGRKDKSEVHAYNAIIARLH